MKLALTNRLNLPRPIMEAATNDDYDPGNSDYTVTGLLQPPRMRRLLQLYPDQCVEDVADVHYRLLGKAVHYILEKGAEQLEADGFVFEERFYLTYQVDVGGKLQDFAVSAQIDLLERASGKLSDYKCTSVFALAKGLKDEHSWQMNFQARAVRLHGYEVNGAEIVGLFRDWSADRADGSPEYPQEPILKQPVPLVDASTVDEWVRSRIRLHEAAKLATTQDQLPLCTPSEQWARVEDDKFAVRRPDAARAFRVFDSEREAREFLSTKKENEYVLEERYGKAVRCNRYCPARNVCEQWKSSKRNPSNQARSNARGSKPQSRLEGLPDDLERL